MNAQSNGVNGEKGGKQVFTTGEVAQICKVSQQTVIRCFDTGRLSGFRIPGSKFRRIPRGALISFMKTNQIPLEELDGSRFRVVLYAATSLPLFQATLIEAASQLETSGYSAIMVDQAVQAGIAISAGDIAALVIEYQNGCARCDTATNCRIIRSTAKFQALPIIVAVSRAIGEPVTTALRDAGANEILVEPTAEQVVKLVKCSAAT